MVRSSKNMLESEYLGETEGGIHISCFFGVGCDLVKKLFGGVFIAWKCDLEEAAHVLG